MDYMSVLKALFWMRVYVSFASLFLHCVEEICSFAGFSLGEFRVRWSWFDAVITDGGRQML